MKTLVLKNNFQMNMTMLPNSFVDHYMANANGEFVKELRKRYAEACTDLLDGSNIGLEISSPPC